MGGPHAAQGHPKRQSDHFSSRTGSFVAVVITDGLLMCVCVVVVIGMTVYQPIDVVAVDSDDVLLMALMSRNLVHLVVLVDHLRLRSPKTSPGGALKTLA